MSVPTRIDFRYVVNGYHGDGDSLLFLETIDAKTGRHSSTEATSSAATGDAAVRAGGVQESLRVSEPVLHLFLNGQDWLEYNATFCCDAVFRIAEGFSYDVDNTTIIFHADRPVFAAYGTSSLTYFSSRNMTTAVHGRAALGLGINIAQGNVRFDASSAFSGASVYWKGGSYDSHSLRLTTPDATFSDDIVTLIDSPTGSYSVDLQSISAGPYPSIYQLVGSSFKDV